MSKKFHCILVLLAATLGGGCSRMEDKQLTIGDVTYTFPAGHVFRFTNPGEGHPFARIRPPGQKFDLIYSEFAKYRRNYQGESVPLVNSINDHSASAFKEFKFSDGITVCRVGPPYYSCGLQVLHDGVPWSVIFNEDQVSSSESIRASAMKILSNYRG